MRRSMMVNGILATTMIVLGGRLAGEAAGAEPTEPGDWKPLFDGKTLAGWKATEFGGEGGVAVKNGELVIEKGASMTGITFKGNPPRMNYEIELEARRLNGYDFFCGLTFPVAKSYCSLILGGWGGGVVGLSSVDGYDASENETTQYIEFNDKQWYKVKVRVTEPRIECWLDGKQVVDQKLKDHKMDTRIEMDLCQPLGIATWETTGGIRNFRMRELTAEEVKKLAQQPEKEE